MPTERNIRDIFMLLRDLDAEFEDVLLDESGETQDVQVKGYGALYSEPIRKIAAFLFQQADLWDAVVAASSSPDPNASIIELARTAEPAFELSSENAHLVGIALVILLVNLEAIATFNMSMSELLADVENGRDEALFQAILLDASVLHSSQAADRISKAALLDDRSFFDKLAKAITRTKPTRPKPHLDGVRLLMNILDDAGELESMTDAQITEWAVDKIGVYPNSGDPLSAIRDQRRKRDRAKEGPKS